MSDLNNDVKVENSVSFSEKHYGKVQFLRLEHGYIRTKAKINGIRDITFYYDSLPEGMKEILALGTQVSFTVSLDGNGKFCAENLEVIKNVSEATSPSLQSVPSMASISSLDISTSDDETKDGQIPSRKSSFSTVLRTPASMQLYLHQLQKINSDSILAAERKRQQFNHIVDSYLLKVISRNFNKQDSSCWLF